MQDVQTLDLAVLATIHGGKPGASHPATPPAHPAQPAPQPAGHAPLNHRAFDGNLGVTARGVQVGLQGHVTLDRTNYARCLDRSEQGNWSADQTLRNCGLPPS